MSNLQNVLWIQCDELRADALEPDVDAHPAVRTPHIAALAAEGIWFERAYTTSPVCVPSRAAMLTGVSPHHSGVLGNEAHAAGAPQAGLPPTFPEVLAEAGWTTANFGKEHLPQGVAPWQRHDATGSSMVSLLQSALGSGVELVRSPTGQVVGGAFPEGVRYDADAVTENTIAALAELAHQPFLVRASFLQPHTPVLVPHPWAGQYDEVSFPLVDSVADSAFERRFSEVNTPVEMDHEARQTAVRHYHGAVAWVDAQVGRLVDALEELGIADRTIIVLTSDHGSRVGDGGVWGKHTFAPASHRVPFLLRVPGRPGGRRADLVCGEDLGPTLLGLLGVDALRHDGIDLMGEERREHFISVIGYGGEGSLAYPNLSSGAWGDGQGWPQRVCVRTEHFRYDVTTRQNGKTVPPKRGDEFFVDRRMDPSEVRNHVAEPGLQDDVCSLRGIAQASAASIPAPIDAEILGQFSPPDGASAVMIPSSGTDLQDC